MKWCEGSGKPPVKVGTDPDGLHLVECCECFYRYVTAMDEPITADHHISGDLVIFRPRPKG